MYRELLQNSNDAEAKNAEVRFSTTSTNNGTPIVSQVVYRNDGHPFRPEDWSRLRNIAEGNPDVSKVGAFGVGAYTMFSICEEPLVISGQSALAFAWRGDALWARTGPVPKPDPPWTTFVLPSRDPYPLPDLVPFAQFLCASLTFTASLTSISLFVNDEQRLSISKNIVQPPVPLIPPRASSWFANDGMVTQSPTGLFSVLGEASAITQSLVAVSVDLDNTSNFLEARFISATANVRVPPDMRRQIVRVTKKQTPPTVKVQVFVDATATPDHSSSATRNAATTVTDAFSPAVGAGRVFIGFRTSQTTGLAAHLAAPLVPTVEREAVDLQNPALRTFNTDLLFVSGMLMRLTLEHSMNAVGTCWEQNAPQRLAEEKKMKQRAVADSTTQVSPEVDQQKQAESEKERETGFSFVRFMTSSVKRIADVLTTNVDFGRNEEDLLNPPDPRPLSSEERDAVMFMRAFSPEKSTPDPTVGALVAKGFSQCMPALSPPVLTQSGVARGKDGRLPFRGIESFVTKNVVRNAILNNAKNYLLHVAGCSRLGVEDLKKELRERVLSEEELERFLRWWVQFAKASPEISTAESLQVKQCMKFKLKKNSIGTKLASSNSVEISLRDILYFGSDQLSSSTLPMPPSVIPLAIQERLPMRILQDNAFQNWFTPLPFTQWAAFIVNHQCMTGGRQEDDDVRLEVLKVLSTEHGRRRGVDREPFEKWLQSSLGKRKCLPIDHPGPAGEMAELPGDLYLSNAEIAIFQGLASFKKVSSRLTGAGVSDEFLLTLGVRKAIAIDFLLTHLDTLKWSDNPAPLIAYLRSVILTEGDLDKLRTCQYLPEASDKTRTYAPSELYLPSSDLAIFPFVKVLQWPSPLDLHERSPDAIFLKNLGCLVEPPIHSVINFIVKDVKDEALHVKCLEFLSEKLRPGGPYYSYLAECRDRLFLPVTVRDPLSNTEVEKQRSSPTQCFWEKDCECMGFPVLDPDINKAGGGVFAERFQCQREPVADQLTAKLMEIVSMSKRKLSSSHNDVEYKKTADEVIATFARCFGYLSKRAREFTNDKVNILRKQAFIPHRDGHGKIKWLKPNTVYFSNDDNDIAGLLYPAIAFDSFLATIGVRSQPSLSDVLSMMIQCPQDVLKKLGSAEKYCELLRRIAANPPFKTITSEMQRSAFLIAYRFEGGAQAPSGDEQAQLATKYTLARASDICIIDNAFLGGMFQVLTAPQESDLERLYESLGAKYISKEVRQAFSVQGQKRSWTPLTNKFLERIQERRPLLVSANASSRPMHSNASAMLADGKLTVYEVASITANYSLRRMTKSNEVTCCSQRGQGNTSIIYLTADFDWFDVGNAVGSLILKRCHLEDSFLLGSILEAPLSQLRARGFPVDRILKVTEPLSPPEPPIHPTESPSSGVASSGTVPGSSRSSSRAPQPQSGPESKEGLHDILKQMFPDVDSSHVRKLLGDKPDLEKLREVADQLADGNYPRLQTQNSTLEPRAGSSAQAFVKPSPVKPATAPERNPFAALSKSKAGGGLLGRALNKLGKNAMGGLGAVGATGMPGLAGAAGLARAGDASDGVGMNGGGLSQESGEIDAARHHERMADVLRRSIRSSSRAVGPEGVRSRDHVESVPEGAREGVSCEIVEGKDLKLVTGPRSSGAANGTRVFASLKTNGCEEFIRKNWAAVDQFATVLRDLCKIYDMDGKCVAIYYEDGGRTIAFNSSGALYFNLRFFCALHVYQDGIVKSECYSYWFTVMAHELAHNLAKGHDKQHGQLTETYVMVYLPKLMTALRSL